jgi:drug/metabolite transporter (DMT)-like permease
VDNEKYRLHGLIFITITLWASAFVAVRFTIEQYTPGNLALLRYITASIVLIPVVIKKKIKIPVLKDLPLIILLGLLGITFYNMFFNEGMRTITAGSASFLLNTVPLFTAILAVIFLKEKLNLMKWIGLITSFIGVSLVAIGEKKSLEFNLGAGLLLSAAICQAIYIIVQKLLLKKYNGFELGIYTVWTGTFFLMGYFPGLLNNIPKASITATISVIYLGIFPAAVGYVAWSMALELAPASYVVTFIYFLPLITLIISKIWINETPDLLSIVGGAVIITGIILFKTRSIHHQEVYSSENPS